jgi:flavorubredoxin
MPEADMSAPKRLLIVHHTQSGNTGRLAEAVLAGALARERDRDADAARLRRRHRRPARVRRPAARYAGELRLHVGRAQGLLRSHLLPLRGQARTGLPYAVFVSAGNDGTGAVREIGRIANGYGWKTVAEALIVRRQIGEADLERARELGEAMAAGLAMGVF